MKWLRWWCMYCLWCWWAVQCADCWNDTAHTANQLLSQSVSHRDSSDPPLSIVSLCSLSSSSLMCREWQLTATNNVCEITIQCRLAVVNLAKLGRTASLVTAADTIHTTSPWLNQQHQSMYKNTDMSTVYAWSGHLLQIIRSTKWIMQ